MNAKKIDAKKLEFYLMKAIANLDEAESALDNAYNLIFLKFYDTELVHNSTEYDHALDSVRDRAQRSLCMIRRKIDAGYYDLEDVED